jgi:hypothetical protein
MVLFKHGAFSNLIKLAQSIFLESLTSSIYSVEKLLRNKRLPDRLAYIDTIRQAVSESDEKDVIQEWCLNQATLALTTYVSPDDRDVSPLVSIVCENGIQSIRQMYVGH